MTQEPSASPRNLAVKPELQDNLRRFKAGIFQALARTWEEYMRSPQFLEAMKQTMDNAIAFRQQTNDFMAKVRNELQAPSREDTDAALLAIRHLETRLLDRLEELERAVGELGARPTKARAAKPAVKPVRKAAGKARPANRKRRKP